MDPTLRSIEDGYARASRELKALLEGATPDGLRRRSNGTRWTNEQLLFHMVFGYMVVRALVPLVHVVSRLPTPAGRAFAALLNAGTRPFDVVNYWGSRAASTVYDRRRMGRNWTGHWHRCPAGWSARTRLHWPGPWPFRIDGTRSSLHR